MTAHDIHALSGAYAVDALDELERARFEAHLAVCADCRAEVADLREAAGLLGDLSGSTPPPALRDRVLAGIRSVRPLPPQGEADDRARAGSDRSGARHRRPAWRPLVAAAAVVAVVGGGTFTVLEQTRDHPAQTQTVADRVLRSADAQSIHVDLPGDASLRLVRSVTERKAVLITHGLQSPPAGKVYELWLQERTGTMVPAGLMSGSGDQQVVLKGDASLAKAAGITVEPAGGSHTPTSAPIALFDFKQST